MSGFTAPFLREWNYNKIQRLTDAGCSDDSIASLVNDDLRSKVDSPQVLFGGADITSYKKLSGIAGEYSLISEKKIKVVTGDGPEGKPA